MQQLYKLFKETTGICTDTRNIQKESLFIALKGRNFNGNTFANKISILEVSDGVYKLKESIPISENTQIEAIVHIEDHKYLLGAESETNEGGYLYSLDLGEFYE